MLAFQVNGHSVMMGLGDDGVPTAPVTAEAVMQQIRDRVASIRSKLVTFGIPGAVLVGGATTLVFAGAFGAARTERVWTPALIIGGATALAGLLGLAGAAAAANTALPPAQPTPAPLPAPTPIVTVPPSIDSLPTASGSVVVSPSAPSAY
jgi:hypothetical protein